MITSDSIVVASSDQVSCNLSGEAAILNMRNGEYCGLNAVGTRVWKLIQEAHSVSEVRDVIMAEYEVDAETCEKDLIELLNDLEARELLDVSSHVP